ncbi:hypothetical protein Nmel_016231 [Mimus melanotis]
MRFVGLIRVCSAASSSLELCCADEAGSELKLGQDTERGAQPLPACSLWFFPDFWLSDTVRCLWAGWERQCSWPGRALGLHGSGFVSAGVWEGVKERCAVPWVGQHSNLGTDAGGSGAVLSLSPAPGEKAVVPENFLG